MEDSNSIFYYYQKLIKLRKEYEIIVYGTYDLILENAENVYAFTSTLDDEKLLVLCNFSKDGVDIKLPEDIHCESVELLINKYNEQENSNLSTALKPYEASVYLLK